MVDLRQCTVNNCGLFILHTLTSFNDIFTYLEADPGANDYGVCFYEKILLNVSLNSIDLIKELIK